MVMEDMDREFRSMVLKLFQLPSPYIPSTIENFEKESKILKGMAFYTKLIHTVPFHETGSNLVPDRRDAILEYCKHRLDSLTQNDTPSIPSLPSIPQPEQLFFKFEVIKEVMIEHALIDQEGKCELNKRQAWKLTALISTITFFKEDFFKEELSEEKMMQSLSAYLKKPFKEGKKTAKGFDDLCNGMKKTFNMLLATKAPLP